MQQSGRAPKIVSIETGTTIRLRWIAKLDLMNRVAMYTKDCIVFIRATSFLKLCFGLGDTVQVRHTVDERVGIVDIVGIVGGDVCAIYFANVGGIASSVFAREQPRRSFVIYQRHS